MSRVDASSSPTGSNGSSNAPSTPTILDQTDLGRLVALPPKPSCPALSPTSASLSESVAAFCTEYEQLSKKIYEAAVSNQWDSLETLWKPFWTEAVSEHPDLLGMPQVAAFCQASDRICYFDAFQALIPDVLAPFPSSDVKRLRAAAKRMDGWLRSALSPVSQRADTRQLVSALVQEVTLFAQRLRRATGLSHLAQAARSVLSNANHVSQMRRDLDRVDIDSVISQLVWTCEGCSEDMVRKFYETFRKQFEGEVSIFSWASWLQTVVDAVLGKYVGSSESALQASELLLRWSLLSSLVIRDLTLRSAASFGMFHLMRLLSDEYMYYLVEMTVATGKVHAPKHNKAMSGSIVSLDMAIDAAEAPETREEEDDNDDQLKAGAEASGKQAAVEPEAKRAKRDDAAATPSNTPAQSQD